MCLVIVSCLEPHGVDGSRVAGDFGSGLTILPLLFFKVYVASG